MNRINLLPPSFIESRRKRRDRIIASMICGVLTVIGAFAGMMVMMQLRNVSARIEAAQHTIAKQEAQSQEQNRPATQRKKLEELLELHGSAKLPLQPSVVLSTLFELQPETMVLSRVMVEVPAAPTAPTAGSASGRPGVLKSLDRPLTLDITGYAMSDLDAAKFMGALNNHPLFSNVMLSSSKRVDLAGTTRFQFSIRAEVRFDRRYQAEAVEVAQP